MSEGAAEAGGGAEALSGDQFGDVTGTDDLPPTNNAQNPGNGLWAFGYYPWPMARRRRKRSRER